jgi:cytochrome c5
VSKHDTHFFNVFSVVLGLLVAFAILVFALARYVGKHEQHAQVLTEPLLEQSVAARLAPPVRVAVAGQDNTALTIAPISTAAIVNAVAAMPENGAEVYETACKTCHGPNVAALLGAPLAGNAAAWQPRIAKGKPTLYEHALKGFTGPTGKVMPAKGNRPDLSDDLVRQAVDHMLEM